MIGKLPNELIIDICIFLELKSKKSFRETSKKINLLTNNYTYAHIGTMLKYYIGLDYLNDNIKIFLNIVNKYNLINYIYKCISHHFFYKSNFLYLKFKLKSFNNVKTGILIKLFSKTKQESITYFTNKRNLLINKESYNYNCTSKRRNNMFRRKLPLSYSLLLAS